MSSVATCCTNSPFERNEFAQTGYLHFIWRSAVLVCRPGFGESRRNPAKTQIAAISQFNGKGFIQWGIGETKLTKNPPTTTKHSPAQNRINRMNEAIASSPAVACLGPATSSSTGTPADSTNLGIVPMERSAQAVSAKDWRGYCDNSFRTVCILWRAKEGRYSHSTSAVWPKRYWRIRGLSRQLPPN
jgi:hypothetical protein